MRENENGLYQNGHKAFDARNLFIHPVRAAFGEWCPWAAFMASFGWTFLGFRLFEYVLRCSANPGILMHFAAVSTAGFAASTYYKTSEVPRYYISYM